MIISRIPNGGGNGKAFKGYIKVNCNINGAMVTAEKDGIRTPVAEVIDGYALVCLEEFGTYTLKSTYSNVTIEKTGVVCNDRLTIVDNFDFYTGELTITIKNADGNGVYTVKDSSNKVFYNENFSAVEGSDFTATLPIYQMDTFKIDVTMPDGRTSATQSATFTPSGTSQSATSVLFKAILNITFDDGAVVDVYNPSGEKVISYTSGESATLNVYQSGTWELKANKPDEDEKVETVEVQGTITSVPVEYNVNMKFVNATIYGFHVNGNESNPDNMITYLSDCENASYTPSKMNFSTGQFDYGSWKDAFFMPKPCMLNYDGTVAYYLNPNDYTKKEDGTPSDIRNTSFNGNAMMEFPKIYWKIVPNTSDDSTADIYISDNKEDDDFECWSNYNYDNKDSEHFYMAIYEPTLDSTGRRRSLSGSTILNGTTLSEERTSIRKNNTTPEIKWQNPNYADSILVDMLLMLISKTTNLQNAFGVGALGNTSKLATTGTLNTKGMFYGTTDNKKAIKVFGMENYWGNAVERLDGFIELADGFYVKLTIGNYDGSTVNDYNDTANGYLKIAPYKAISGYFKKMKYTKIGFLPYEAGGTNTTYYRNKGYVGYNVHPGYLMKSGDYNDGNDCGPLYWNSTNNGSDPAYLSTRLACKP